MPITDRQLEYAKKVHARLEEAGLRSHLDDRKEKVNLKIREAQLQKVPYMLVVGDREAEAGTVSVRHRKHADMGVEAAGAVYGRRVQAGRVEIRDGIIARTHPEPHHRLHRRGWIHAFADARAQLHFRLHLLLCPDACGIYGGLKPEDWQRWGQFTTFKATRRNCCGANCARISASIARRWSILISRPKSRAADAAHSGCAARKRRRACSCCKRAAR